LLFLVKKVLKIRANLGKISELQKSQLYDYHIVKSNYLKNSIDKLVFYNVLYIKIPKPLIIHILNSKIEPDILHFHFIKY